VVQHNINKEMCTVLINLSFSYFEVVEANNGRGMNQVHTSFRFVLWSWRMTCSVIVTYLSFNKAK
jgi:hypothetical protein